MVWTSVLGGLQSWELVWKPRQPGVCPGLLEAPKGARSSVRTAFPFLEQDSGKPV